VSKILSANDNSRRVRITSNGWAAVVGAGVMFAMAVQTQSVWMQVVGSALVGLLGISWLSVLRRRSGLTVTLQAPTEVVVGIPFDLQLVVHNAAKQATPPVRISYRIFAEPPLLAPAVVYVDPIPPGDTTVATVSRVALRRGSVGGTIVVVDTIGSFGFFTSTRLVPGTRGFWAAPLDVPVIDFPRLLSTEVDGAGPMGPGLDVRGVREWRPGDAVRHVHWRSTARTGRIAVLEYGEPTIDKIGLFVAGTTADPRFEATLAIAASTAWRAVDDGIAVVIGFADAALANNPITRNRADSVPPRLSLRSWHRIFAALRPAVPTPAEVDEIFANEGFGGIVLMVLGNGLSPEFLSYVESAAMAAGSHLIDIGDYFDDLRIDGLTLDGQRTRSQRIDAQGIGSQR
jgi:uncharacterized protein (DUF58 family)